MADVASEKGLDQMPVVRWLWAPGGSAERRGWDRGSDPRVAEAFSLRHSPEHKSLRLAKAFTERPAHCGEGLAHL